MIKVHYKLESLHGAAVLRDGDEDFETKSGVDMPNLFARPMVAEPMEDYARRLMKEAKELGIKGFTVTSITGDEVREGKVRK